MKLSEMEVGKRYRLLPDDGLKSELHNAVIEKIEDTRDAYPNTPDPDRPLVRAVKVGKRTKQHAGCLVHNGDTLRLLPGWVVDPA